VSGLVLVTGAAGDGPGSRAAGWPGCCVAGLLLDRGVPVRVGKVRGDTAVQRAIARTGSPPRPSSAWA